MKRSRFISRWAWAWLALCLLATPALAQPVPPDEALQHYERGGSYFEAKDYQRALEEFQSSYSIRQIPRVLINIGSCHFRLGNPERAIALYESYLRSAPDSVEEAAVKAEVEKLIANAREAIDAKKQLINTSTSSPSEPNQLTSSSVNQTDKAPAEKSKPFYRQGLFWGVVGALVISSATAIGLGVFYATKGSSGVTYPPDVEVRTLRF